MTRPTRQGMALLVQADDAASSREFRKVGIQSAHTGRPPTRRELPLTKPKVALPLVAAAALLGLLWFSFREHPQEPGVPTPVPHATGTSTH